MAKDKATREDLGLSQLERMEMKIDFMFGVMSNENMAQEFLSVYREESSKGEQADKELLTKAESMFRYHHKNVKDSVQFYVDLFGAASNEKIVGLLTDLGYNNTPEEGKEPAVVAEVDISGENTSEKA